jgi:hypothetical protein
MKKPLHHQHLSDYTLSFNLHSSYASTIQENHTKKPTKRHLFTTTLHLHHNSKHVTKEDIIFSKQQKISQVKEFQHGIMDKLTTTIMNIT